MNILFITDEDIDPSRGGVKRSLHVLTREFMSRYRIRCCLAYIHAYPGSETSEFHAKIRLAKQDAGARLKEFILGHAIDVVVLQKMLPGKYRILPVLKWAAGRGMDGTVVFFDGPKDMFRYLLDLDSFKPGATADQVAAVFVTDYYSTRPIDGRTASYVVGSDVMGPMGAELVPTADPGHAGTLLKDHAGERIVSFGEVTAELVKP